MSARFFFIVCAIYLTTGAAAAALGIGSTISDFRMQWGSPVHHEVLARTATLKWKKPRSGIPFGTDVLAAEVEFLDGRACSIVLRSERSASPDYLVHLVGPFVSGLKASEMPKPKFKSPDGTVYELRDSTVVMVNKFPGHDVIVIMGGCYLRHQDIFNREAAKIRRPTPNH